MPVLPDNEVAIMNVWEETLRALDLYFHKVKDHCFDDIASTVMMKILYYVNEENILTQHDEEIYDYYKQLMGFYDQATTTFSDTNNDIQDKRINEIIRGIRAVISSQINAFEEYRQTLFNGVCEDVNENPIKQEKALLLDNLMQVIVSDFNELRLQTKKEPDKVDKVLVRKVTVEYDAINRYEGYVFATKTIYRQLLDVCCDEIYSIYLNAANECAMKINNLQQRRIANYFYEALKAEYENLGAIIKIQVTALETQIRNKTVSEAEEKSVQQGLMILREAYQVLKMAVSRVTSLFKEAESFYNKQVPPKKEDIIGYITVNGQQPFLEALSKNNQIPEIIDEYMNDWSKAYNLFIKQYHAHLLLDINNIGDTRELEERTVQLLEEMRDKLELSREMSAIFGELILYYTDNLEVLGQSKDIAILNGIQETLLIKIDSIEEHASMFEEQLKYFTDYELPLTTEAAPDDRQLERLFSQALNIWNNLMLDLKFPLDADIFNQKFKEAEEAINQIDLLRETGAARIRNTQEYNDRIKRKISQFLKEHLLFEITTYEEIVNYSIAKIDKDSCSVIEGYVNKAREITQILLRLLSAHQIEKIAPERGDWFNGKEHEVLMAEKDQQLQKGQVVKLMNSGFKYDNVVLLRANVIAAR